MKNDFVVSKKQREVKNTKVSNNKCTGAVKRLEKICPVCCNSYSTMKLLPNPKPTGASKD